MHAGPITNKKQRESKRYAVSKSRRVNTVQLLCSSGPKKAQIDCRLICVGVTRALGQDLPPRLDERILPHFSLLSRLQFRGHCSCHARRRSWPLRRHWRRLCSALLCKSLHVLHVLHLLHRRVRRHVRRCSTELCWEHLLLLPSMRGIWWIVAHLLSLLRLLCLHLLLSLLVKVLLLRCCGSVALCLWVLSLILGCLTLI